VCSSDLLQGDIVFGNLESPITEASKRNESHYSKLIDDPILGRRIYLKASPIFTNSLKIVGFNVLSIANNHILDYGDQGLTDTINYLYESGISTVGAGLNLSFARKPIIVKIKSKKIGFLAYSYTYEATRNRPGCAPLWKFLIRQDVKCLKENSDIVIVSFHYGKEFSFIPSKFQKLISHFAIDSGADIVLGHHSHTFQPIEIYKGKIIAYSLGNFLFDYNYYGVNSYKKLLYYTRFSAILKLTIHDNGNLTYDIFPIWINENFQLEPISKEVIYSTTKYTEKNKVGHIDFRSKRALFSHLFRLLWMSVRGNRSNIPLLISRALSAYGLL
jgi:poly-gamma-glutamate capsule biosynthesis protein CapA/YwtB (metallophosphatase superfamily)